MFGPGQTATFLMIECGAEEEAVREISSNRKQKKRTGPKKRGKWIMSEKRNWRLHRTGGKAQVLLYRNNRGNRFGKGNKGTEKILDGRKGLLRREAGASAEADVLDDDSASFRPVSQPRERQNEINWNLIFHVRITNEKIACWTEGLANLQVSAGPAGAEGRLFKCYANE